jgi:hypothetical protein
MLDGAMVGYFIQFVPAASHTAAGSGLHTVYKVDNGGWKFDRTESDSWRISAPVGIAFSLYGVEEQLVDVTQITYS